MTALAYYVGDIPAQDLVVEPVRNGDLIDLDPFDSAEVTLRDPNGETVDPSGFLSSIEDGHVVIEWPGESVFETVGVYEMSLVLVSDAGPRETVSAIRIIVEDPANGWHTLASAREDWTDAPDDNSILFDLLYAARVAVEDFAPALAEDQFPPLNYRKAQAMHARNLWNAVKVNTDGAIGTGGYVIQPKPLDWHVAQLLRPRRGIPRVA